MPHICHRLISCHWSCDPRWVKISGHSEQLGPCGYFVNNRHSSQNSGASCIGGFGQTDGQRKFELGIPQNQGASYIRSASYIRDKKVIFFSILESPEQSGTKPNLVAKIWLPKLLTFGHGLPKLVANISSDFHHLVNTWLAVGSLVKWLPIKVANPSKIDKLEWFIARRLQMAPSDCNHL